MWRHAKLRRPTTTIVCPVHCLPEATIPLPYGVSHTSIGRRPHARGTTVRSLACYTHRATRIDGEVIRRMYRGTPLSLARSLVIRTHHRSPAANSFRARPHRTVQKSKLDSRHVRRGITLPDAIADTGTTACN